MKKPSQATVLCRKDKNDDLFSIIYTNQTSFLLGIFEYFRKNFLRQNIALNFKAEVCHIFITASFYRLLFIYVSKKQYASVFDVDMHFPAQRHV